MVCIFSLQLLRLNTARNRIQKSEEHIKEVRSMLTSTSSNSSLLAPPILLKVAADIGHGQLLSRQNKRDAAVAYYERAERLLLQMSLKSYLEKLQEQTRSSAAPDVAASEADEAEALSEINILPLTALLSGVRRRIAVQGFLVSEEVHAKSGLETVDAASEERTEEIKSEGDRSSVSLAQQLDRATRSLEMCMYTCKFLYFSICVYLGI
jgi:hypothetical protein